MKYFLKSKYNFIKIISYIIKKSVIIAYIFLLTHDNFVLYIYFVKITLWNMTEGFRT